MIGKPHCRPEPLPMTDAVSWGSPDLTQSRGMVGGRGRHQHKIGAQ